MEGRNISKCVSFRGINGNKPVYNKTINRVTRLMENNKFILGFCRKNNWN